MTILTCNAIIFDLDGTLVNTAPDVRLALNRTLARYGQDEIAANEIYGLIGGGVRIMLEKVFAQRHILLSADTMHDAIQHYLYFYQMHPVVETEVYEDVYDVLKELKNTNIKLGICTNKPSVMAHLLLEKLKLKHFFSAIVAGDEVQRPKPDGFHLHEVLRQMQAHPVEAIMIGDSEIDMISAKNAGMPFVGVSYGYETKPLEADIILHHFRDLRKLIVKENVCQQLL